MGQEGGTRRKQKQGEEVKSGGSESRVRRSAEEVKAGRGGARRKRKQGEEERGGSESRAKGRGAGGRSCSFGWEPAVSFAPAGAKWNGLWYTGGRKLSHGGEEYA